MKTSIEIHSILKKCKVTFGFKYINTEHILIPIVFPWIGILQKSALVWIIAVQANKIHVHPVET